MTHAPKTVIDVRPIPPRDKHNRIFETFDTLDSGETMLLLNDHDPTPLKYHFGAVRPDQYTWSPLEEGPVEWRIAIGKI